MPSNPFRTGYVATAEDGANVTFETRNNGDWYLLYQPAPEALRIAALVHQAFSPPSGLLLLAERRKNEDVVVTHPINTTATSRRFLDSKYESLRTITFEGFHFSDVENLEGAVLALRGLPTGFVKDPYFGLGINYDIRFMVENIERLGDVTDLRVCRGRDRVGLPRIEGVSYFIAANSFDDTRRAINRIHDKALSIATDEKRVLAHNELLSAVDRQRFPEQYRPYRKDAIVEALGNAASRPLGLSKEDQQAVLSVTKATAQTISRKDPHPLLELSREIELVTLEALVARLREMLTKKLPEATWQKFLGENPFILKMAFGFPVMMMGDQVSSGGWKFSGKGGKVSDFAVKAAKSGNLALIEIKTPDTQLLEKTPYRGEVFSPTREVAGGVNQLLDQRYHLQKSLLELKDNTGVWDVESYAIQGLVIAGRIPSSKPELKSFELFRNALKSVLVLTYDELLLKLEHLLEVLREPAEQPPPRRPFDPLGEDD
ncbi:DUF4263 domain-containing protein [Rhizobium leguminosarum]|uniref:Shedu immune nuclease family protein n=1 Tax=Rhizobium leguminosarum TaxID=384 RepID=UPI0010375680|nr:Shedu immune nuclease family protein [Rhizobium leguminosarum]TBG89358.1 DUF4263 domain-containing protein [Rhizobium leguminosarum]